MLEADPYSRLAAALWFLNQGDTEAVALYAELVAASRLTERIDKDSVS